MNACEVTGGVTIKMISWILLIIILRWSGPSGFSNHLSASSTPSKSFPKIILQSGDCFEMIVEPPQTGFIVNMLEITFEVVGSLEPNYFEVLTVSMLISF